MTDEPERSRPGKPAAKAERERRLAEALRANLKRRKAAVRPGSPEVEPPAKPQPGQHLE